MEPLLIIVHWLHVILAIFWFGGALYRYFILFPILARLPAAQQRLVGKQLSEQTDTAIVVTALLVIVLGIIRGTVFGQIHDAATLFQTYYGATWLIALITAILLFGWEVFAVNPHMENIFTDPDDDEAALDLTRAFAGLRTLALTGLGGFAIIFTCMILMRFGY